MIQRRYTSSDQHTHAVYQQRASLLQQHPISLPIFLVSSAILLVIGSFFADTLFPILKFIGSPAPLICVLLACVLGICGVLTTIIGIIEHLDRQKLPIPLLSHAKEHRYDCN